MKVEERNIKGVFTIEPDVYQDTRGFFMESFKIFKTSINHYRK